MSTFESQLKQISAEALEQLKNIKSLEEVESFRVTFFGKKGKLSELSKSLGTASKEDRPKWGSLLQECRQKVDSTLQELKDSFERKALEEKLVKEKIDVTLPSRKFYTGSLHPVTQAKRKIESVFKRLGFSVTTGPEIETDYMNFEAANIPKDHPARDMHDTFFLGPDVILRTHTTPVQMRTMLSQKWPVRILCPGTVYRVDNDATHSPMFHQIEGLWVDRGVKMSDLKGTLEFFAKEIFGPDARVRFRPSYFPFVEPGVEVDIWCDLGNGFRWLEIMGAGMVHPRLFEMAGYEKEGLSGFAFGIGIDRVALIQHKVPDLRYFFQGDMRFLSQF